MSDKFEGKLAMIVWLLSLAINAVPPLMPEVPLLYFLPLPLSLLATTLNLLHQRQVSQNAGAPFQQRVRDCLADDLAAAYARLEAMEKAVEDIRESQIQIGGAFRGRARP